MADEGPLILVVDDVPDARAMYAVYLTHHGFRVVEATNGVEAIEQAYSHAPDLILMDLGLPHLDGWEATRRIKADPRTQHTPVLAISGHAYADAMTRAETAGVDAFFVKPCLPRDVVAKIREMLRRPS
jgi:CheY-like chemotaxis protein